MTPTLMVLIAAAIAILAYVARAFQLNHSNAEPPPRAEPRSAYQPRASTPAAPPARKPQAPPKTVSTRPPELYLLEWEPKKDSEPEVIQASVVGPVSPDSPLNSVNPVTSASHDVMRAKLRDRYIAIRFPGVARSSDDLRDAERVIKGVRLYFEEQKFDRADELLELAIGQAGSARLLRLARLELAYLRRDAAGFTEFARDFCSVYPGSVEWLEVARLGRALAPAETALFGNAQGARAQDSYGPWPDMPNWLQASWDLTPEVLGADFHREMSAPRTPAVPASQRSAA